MPASGLTVTFEGADDLAAALLELPKRATEKAVVRRSLTKAAQPMRDLMSALAPYRADDEAPHLRDVILVGPKTSARSGAQFARAGDVSVYIGPLRSLHRFPHAVVMEFGSFKDAAQPYMRPAWEAKKDEVLSQIGYWMWTEIDGAALRLARRAARGA